MPVHNVGSSPVTKLQLRTFLYREKLVDRCEDGAVASSRCFLFYREFQRTVDLSRVFLCTSAVSWLSRLGAKAAQVNWQRGLPRIWLLLSAAWIIGWTVNLIVEGDTGRSATSRISLRYRFCCLARRLRFAVWLSGRMAFRGCKPDSAVCAGKGRSRVPNFGL